MADNILYYKRDVDMFGNTGTICLGFKIKQEALQKNNFALLEKNLYLLDASEACFIFLMLSFVSLLSPL